MRRRRRRTVIAVAVTVAIGALVIESPASGQIAEPLDRAAVGVVDPASMMDVAGFVERATAWAAARAEHRVAAIERAEDLAALTKAAEDEAVRAAEEAAEEEAREEAARREAEEAARRAAEQAATTTTTTTTTTTVAPPADPPAGDGAGDPDDSTVPAPDGGPTPEQWHALRDCESGNNYRAVSPSGRYRGAYQFSVTTWDWLAGSRYPELVGVDPIDVSSGDQDRMAAALYEIYGNSPWPVCGGHLP